MHCCNIRQLQSAALTVSQFNCAAAQDGYVVLTNYRLIWMSSRSGPDGVPCHLPLPAVGHAEVHGGVAIFKAARMKLQVRVDDEAYPTPGGC